MKDKQSYQIGVIGAGAWGTALANIVAKKEKVILWAKEKSVCDNINKFSENKRYLPKIKLSKKIKCTTSIVDVAGCDILFLVSPVQYLSTNLLKLKKIIETKTIFVCCSKGIEMNSLKLPSEIVSSIFPKNKIAIISGPNVENFAYVFDALVTANACIIVKNKKELINSIKFLEVSKRSIEMGKAAEKILNNFSDPTENIVNLIDNYLTEEKQRYG